MSAYDRWLLKRGFDYNDLTGKILETCSLTRDIHTCLRFNLCILYKAKNLGFKNMQFDNWIYGIFAIF